MRELHSPREAARWLRGRVTGTLQSDSRKVGAGDGFIAWPGAATDGRKHVPSALTRERSHSAASRGVCRTRIRTTPPRRSRRSAA